MEGPVFHALYPQEHIKVVPRLQVLARSSPEDKKILVETLRSLGKITGVTGDSTNDGPALKTANIRFSMGITGTEVSKEASDILMDGNFTSTVKAIMWGHCVNDTIHKFLQFQISTNITAVIITFVSAVASDDEESILSAIQLLWINIIMNMFAALTLATDPASVSLLDRKPDTLGTRLFTADMIKMIIVFASCAVFQVTPIPSREWGISPTLGFVSIPLGVLIRCIPTPPLERAIIKLRIMRPDKVLPLIPSPSLTRLPCI